MFDLIIGASLVVKAVLVMLLGMSVVSWAVIAYKVRQFGRAERESEVFLETYLEQPLDMAYREAKEHPSSPLAALFQAGYRDLSQLRRASSSPPKSDQIEAVVDRLAWTETEQQHRLGRGLAFLATTGSSAPFIGLFGTVIGIMNAFQHIGATGSASLAVVAPGIAEALFATAVGLFAAIPAVIGYNYATARLSRSLDRLEAFRSDFSNALRRSGTQPA